MTKQSENPFVSFYGEHAISPVRQDISNLKNHLLRRGNLYRTLGIPLAMFRGRRILEVGPGGGYNSVALFTWGAQVDFVEPNPTAQVELEQLLKKNGVTDEQWKLFPGLIEDYDTSDSYDLVLAEGFIPGLYDRTKVISKLKSLVQPGGVIVVTCFDDLSIFFENLKRLLAFRLTGNVPVFEDKVKILSRAFESHLNALGHSTRPIEDYVMDNLLNPAMYGKMFSIADSIEEFGWDFEFLGSSPSMFTNYQWYKNVNFDYRSNLLQQFKEKRHCLLLWDLPETTRTASENDELVELAYKIRNLGAELEQEGLNFFESVSGELILLLKRFIANSKGIDNRIDGIINEVIVLLMDKSITPEKISKSVNFAKAFGRGQQYVSLQKRFNTN